MTHWIPIEVNTPRKVELVKIIKATGRLEDEALGLIVKFWCWVSRELKDGHVNLPVSVLPDVVGGDEAFWSAVAAAGWMTPDEDGQGFVVPRSEHWMTDAAKERLFSEFKGGVGGGSLPCPDRSAPSRPISVPPRTVPTATERASDGAEQDGTGRSGRAFEGGPSSEQNGTERNGVSVFDWLTAADLRDTAKLAEWLKRQDKEGDRPVIKNPQLEDLYDIVAAAEQSLKKGHDHKRYFSALVGRKDFDNINAAARKRGQKRVDQYLREKNGGGGVNPPSGK